jgi:hypothetical protein
LTRDLGGTVLSLDDGGRNGIPQSITVQIPAMAFEEFYASLRGVGELEGAETLRDENKGPGPVSLRILLIGP